MMRKTELALLVVFLACLSVINSSNAPIKSTTIEVESASVPQVLLVRPNGGITDAQLPPLRVSVEKVGGFGTISELSQYVCRQWGMDENSIRTCEMLNFMGKPVDRSSIRRSVKKGEAVYVRSLIQPFIWPPLNKGTKRKLRLESARHREHLVLKTLSAKPRLFEVKNFMTPEECDTVISLSTDLERSGTVGGGEQWRKSEQTWLHYQVHPVMTAIHDRFLELLRLRLTFFLNIEEEKVQVVHYQPNMYYRAHFDSHKNETQPDVEHPVRFVTALVYLNDVHHGGETNFPLADANITIDQLGYSDRVACNTGYMVKPQKGKLVFWYNVDGPGDVSVLDTHSLHAGCMLPEGSEKWVMNKWMYNRIPGYGPAPKDDL